MKTFKQWVEAYGRRNPPHRASGQVKWTYEDEAHDRELDFTIDYTFSPGEKKVMYYPDGSGYPGSPHQIELWRVTCTKVTQYNPESGNVVNSGPPAAVEAKALGDQFDALIQKDKRLRDQIEEEVLKDQPSEDDRY